MDANDARRLAMRLVNDIKSGAVRDYVFARDAILESIPDLECEACSGTGIRTDEVGDDLGMPTLELRADHAERLGRSHGWCNMCHGEGDISSWEKAHRLSVEDVKEFAKFLHSCGGFSIR
jgi:hypothetical protein